MVKVFWGRVIRKVSGYVVTNDALKLKAIIFLNKYPRLKYKIKRIVYVNSNVNANVSLKQIPEKVCVVSDSDNQRLIFVTSSRTDLSLDNDLLRLKAVGYKNKTPLEKWFY